MGSQDLAPSAIRALCRSRFVDALPELTRIANDPDAKDADRIGAIRALGDFGLGKADQGAVHVHAEAGAMLGVVMLPALETGKLAERAAASRALAPGDSTPNDVGDAK